MHDIFPVYFTSEAHVCYFLFRHSLVQTVWAIHEAFNLLLLCYISLYLLELLFPQQSSTLYLRMWLCGLELLVFQHIPKWLNVKCEQTGENQCEFSFNSFNTSSTICSMTVLHIKISKEKWSISLCQKWHCSTVGKRSFQ